MSPHIFTKRCYFLLTAVCLLFFGCADQMGSNTGIQTTGTQPDIPTEVQAVDGSTISVTDFNGVPTALWFWSPN
jgi:hypothetical protein